MDHKIPAKVWTDDQVINVEFDAIEWLKNADIQELLEMEGCDWSRDLPADRVAINEAASNEAVADLFQYINLINKHTRNHIGFECLVDRSSAVNWLAANRPDDYHKLAVEKGLI